MKLCYITKFFAMSKFLSGNISGWAVAFDTPSTRRSRPYPDSLLNVANIFWICGGRLVDASAYGFEALPEAPSRRYQSWLDPCCVRHRCGVQGNGEVCLVVIA